MTLAGNAETSDFHKRYFPLPRHRRTKMKDYRREYLKIRRLLRRASVFVAPPAFASGGTPDPESIRRHFDNPQARGAMLLRDEIEAAVGKATWKELAWDYNGGAARAAKGKRRTKR